MIGLMMTQLQEALDVARPIGRWSLHCIMDRTMLMVRLHDGRRAAISLPGPFMHRGALHGGTTEGWVEIADMLIERERLAPVENAS